MGKIILYHGSSEIINQPVYGRGKPYNDYGLGFYCTESKELAKEWACTENTDGFANKYEIEVDDLNILNLSSENYTILHWLALLMEYRVFRISSPLMRRAVEWIKNNFLIDLNPYDVVIGYRADDSYFSFARDFVNNAISLQQLNYAMRLGKLGEQFVLKSPLAFKKINFLSYELVNNTEYYAKRKVRDDEVRNMYRIELENNDVNGLYIRDIMQAGGDLNEMLL